MFVFQTGRYSGRTNELFVTNLQITFHEDHILFLHASNESILTRIKATYSRRMHVEYSIEIRTRMEIFQ